MRGEFSGAVGNLAVVDWQVGTVQPALNLSTLGSLYFGIFAECKSHIWPRFVSSKEILFSYAKGACVTHTHNFDHARNATAQRAETDTNFTKPIDFWLQIYSDLFLGVAATSLMEFMIQVKFAKLTFTVYSS